MGIDLRLTAQHPVVTPLCYRGVLVKQVTYERKKINAFFNDVLNSLIRLGFNVHIPTKLV